jgi:hypothetical protein
MAGGAIAVRFGMASAGMKSDTKKATAANKWGSIVFPGIFAAKLMVFPNYYRNFRRFV